MSHQSEIIKYCNEIIKGRITAGVYCKKSVKRFLGDLKKSEQKTYPYFMDWNEVEKIISFAEKLVIPDIGGKLKLYPWQKFIYCNVWGWKYKSDPKRKRTLYAFVECARKQSKTTSLMFPMILWDCITTPNAESYFVSQTGDQSEKSFIDLSNIVKNTPMLSDEMKCYSSSIVYKYSRITCFSSETKGTDSYRNSFSCFDEVHGYENDLIIQAFAQGGRTRPQGAPELLITTAGNDTNSVCYNEVKRCRNVLDGVIDDPSYFGILYEIDPEDADKWKDPDYFKKVAMKANPALGTFLREDVLLSELNQVLLVPSRQRNFAAKTLNLWDKGGLSNWLSPEKLVSKDIDFESEFNGCKCWGGLDLSSVSDLTVYTLCFVKDGEFFMKHRYFIPSEQIKNKYQHDNINFQDWIDSGLVIATAGSTVDYDVVIDYIKRDSQIFDIQEICYDPWQSKLVINKLNDELPNITYIEFSQALKNFAEPTKNYEKKVLDGKVIDANPVAHWNLGNCVIKVDPSGNYKPLKSNSNSTQRIDGTITSIMALSRATNAENEKANQVDFSTILNLF